MLPEILQGDASSSATASTPRIMERAPVLHEITPEQAVNLEQDRYDWECELRHNFPRLGDIDYLGCSSWKSTILARPMPETGCLLDVSGTSVGITGSITQWPPMEGTPQPPDDWRSHFGALCIEHYLYPIYKVRISEPSGAKSTMIRPPLGGESSVAQGTSTSSFIALRASTAPQLRPLLF